MLRKRLIRIGLLGILLVPCVPVANADTKDTVETTVVVGKEALKIFRRMVMGDSVAKPYQVMHDGRPHYYYILPLEHRAGETSRAMVFNFDTSFQVKGPKDTDRWRHFTLHVVNVNDSFRARALWQLTSDNKAGGDQENGKPVGNNGLVSFATGVDNLYFGLRNVKLPELNNFPDAAIVLLEQGVTPELVNADLTRRTEDQLKGKVTLSH
jgi:hypothetical protein